MKKLFIVALILGMAVATSYAHKKPPPGCGTDANGVKYCCVQTGMGGVCYPQNW